MLRLTPTLLERSLLVALVALLPAFCLSINSELNARANRQRLIGEEALRLVRLVTADQQQIIEGARQSLNALGIIAQAFREPQACQHAMQELLRADPRYSLSAITDLDGRVTCSSHPGAVGANVSDRPYFSLALQAAGFAIGEYSIGRITNARVLHFAQPYTDPSGRIAGIALLGLNLDWLTEQLLRLPVPEDATVCIMDRTGRILARHPDAAKYVGSLIPESILLRLQGSEPNVQEMPGIDGSPRIVGISPMSAEPKGIAIAVGLNKSSAFAEVIRSNRKGVLLIGSGMLLALALTALGVIRLIRGPAARLLAAAQRWQQGDLSARVAFGEERSEFGRLGAAFDSMAAALQARDQASQAAREKLARHGEVLEGIVEQRTEALRESERRLARAQKLEAVGQLTGGVAHDFNNLIQAVDSSLELALGALARGNRQLAQSLVTNAKRAITRGARLATQLLTFSRRQPLRPEPMHVGQVLAEMNDLIRRAVPATVRIELNAGPDLWPTLADPSQFEAAILNLAINARDAMPSGGMLKIAARNARVNAAEAAILDVKTGDYVRIEVADTGLGIAQEHLDHLFDPFFTTKDPGKGSGLGLSMVHGFVRQAGGTITVESRSGEGTTFALFLPRSDAAPTIATSEQ
ncbi:MAG: HAMP domain-containing protein, partial [Acetobacteraceae bacterium]|nr:HAMP domain-containing protein [Acetobacteraceae bacterium]